MECGKDGWELSLSLFIYLFNKRECLSFLWW